MNKPMSKQMQKLADKYEKATGKKFCGKTNAQKIRAMSDEELAVFLADADVEYCHVGLCKDGETCRICCLRWLQMTAEEDDHDERKENENVRR